MSHNVPWQHSLFPLSGDEGTAVGPAVERYSACTVRSTQEFTLVIIRVGRPTLKMYSVTVTNVVNNIIQLAEYESNIT